MALAHAMNQIEAHLTPSSSPSPFLPGTNIRFAWDSTTLGAFKTCPRLYQYQYVDFWGSGEESIHLRFGQEYHQALQDYAMERAAGIGHDDAVHDVIRALLERTWNPAINDSPAGPWTVNEETKAGKYKNRRTLVRAVCDYLDHFRDDAAQTHILDNGKPAVELSFRFELDWGPNQRVRFENDPFLGQVIKHTPPQPYLLCGHLDRVVDFQGSLFVMDHKTTTTTPGSYYFDQFQPNNQMTLYTLASLIVIDSPVKGVIISAAQLMVDSTRFVRGFTYRTPDQLEEWTADLHRWLDLAESYATAGYWPQNDTACDKFGGCRFRDICSKSPQVREQFLKSKFTKLEEKDRWNPLIARG